MKITKKINYIFEYEFNNEFHSKLFCVLSRSLYNNKDILKPAIPDNMRDNFRLVSYTGDCSKTTEYVFDPFMLDGYIKMDGSYRQDFVKIFITFEDDKFYVDLEYRKNPIEKHPTYKREYLEKLKKYIVDDFNKNIDLINEHTNEIEKYKKAYADFIKNINY